MNDFTQTSCQVIREKLNSTLAEVGASLGVGLKLGPGSFDKDSISFKLDVTAMGENGEIVDIREMDWKKYAESFGLKPGWLGKNFRSVSGNHKIIGLDTRKRKYPVITECLGLTYKHSVINVKNFMRGQ